MKEKKPGKTKMGQELIKALDEVVGDTVAPTVKAAPTETALGVYKDYNTGEWMVAKLKYNPLTHEVVWDSAIAAGPGRDFGIEKFKLTAVDEGIV